MATWQCVVGNGGGKVERVAEGGSSQADKGMDNYMRRHGQTPPLTSAYTGYA